MKVFLDSNILFSIAYTGLEKSNIYLIFDFEGVDVYVSELVKQESFYNIQRKKPESESVLDQMIKDVVVLDDVLVSEDSDTMIKALPINDGIILWTAVKNGMDFFITGNTKDFGGLLKTKIGDMLVLTPKSFLLREWERMKNSPL
jgi:predicted nucleic acid-binding protein